MSRRGRFWLYYVAGDIVVACASPGQAWVFYLLSGLVVAAVASALAGYP